MGGWCSQGEVAVKIKQSKKGVVVTLLASLELAKDGYIDLIQNKSEELFIKSKRSSSFGS